MPKATSQSSDIQQLKTDVALMRKDFQYQSQAMVDFSKKLEEIGHTVENLKYVPLNSYHEYRQEDKEIMAKFDKRLADVEHYQINNDPGVKLSNKVVGNIFTIIALGGAVVFLGVAAWSVIKGVVL